MVVSVCVMSVQGSLFQDMWRSSRLVASPRPSQDSQRQTRRLVSGLLSDELENSVTKQNTAQKVGTLNSSPQNPRLYV